MISAGIICALDWRCLLPLVVIFLIALAITKTVSKCSLTVAVVYPIITLLISVFVDHSTAWLPMTIIALCFSVVVIYMHRSNIKRILNGTEPKTIVRKKGAPERISPVNISVHTTNPELRVKMMKNPHAGEVLRFIPMLAEGGIHLNCQIVLCPEWNDGEELDRTLRDLTSLCPAVQSVAVVPVGLTRHREGLEKLRMFTPEECCAVIDQKGFTTELLVSYEPYFQLMNEWWKQLYGESEGKDNKGLLPDSVIFSTDLHSLGQYIQEGRRNLFETVMQIEKAKSEVVIGTVEGNGDGLNFLAGKTMDYINKKAFQGTLLAHNDGGVPNIVLSIPEADEFELGWLIYFFEKACAVSGYTLGVNPFNQPGVEAYKKNMFALLGKPGYEDMKADLEARLSE